MTKVLNFLRDDSGATAIEYGLIAGGMAVAVIAAIQILGPQIGTTFQAIATALQTNSPN